MPLRKDSNPLNVKPKVINFYKLATIILVVVVVLCLGMVAYGMVYGISPLKTNPTPTVLPITAASTYPLTPTPESTTTTPQPTATTIPTAIPDPTYRYTYSSGSGHAMSTAVATNTPTLNPTPTQTIMPTATASPTVTATPTPNATSTPIPTPTVTATPIPTPKPTGSIHGMIGGANSTTGAVTVGNKTVWCDANGYWGIDGLACNVPISVWGHYIKYGTEFDDTESVTLAPGDDQEVIFHFDLNYPPIPTGTPTPTPTATPTPTTLS